MDDAGLATTDGGTTGGLYADQTRSGVHETGEDPDGIRSSTDAGDHDVGNVPDSFLTLCERLVADDAMKLSNHPRIRMRTHHRTEAVMGALD